jgi:gluconokinase
MLIESIHNSHNVLAVDIGTSGCRAMVCEKDGTVVSTAERSYGVFYDNNGFAEQDPEQIFDLFIEIAQQCITESRVPIDSVIIGSVLHSLVLLDGGGIPLTPLSIWADTRAVDQCQRLQETFEFNRWHERTGCPLSPSYPLYRLLWYKEKEPTIYSRLRMVVSIKSYIHYRLFGCYLEDHSVASGSGMFNIQARVWDQEILDYLELDGVKFPEAVPVEHQLPEVNSSLSLDASGKIKWIIGGADGPLAHLGTAGWNKNVASLTLGTSGAVRMRFDNPLGPLNSSLWCYVLNNNSYISGLATNNGGNVVDWFVKLLFPAGVGWDDLENVLLSSPPDPELLFIPSLFKDRDLSKNDSRSGQFIGIKHHHTREDMLKAVVEGVVFNTVYLFDRLRFNCADIKAVALSGRLTQSKFVCQLINSLIDLSVIIFNQDNASLVGLTRVVFESKQIDFEGILERTVKCDIDSAMKPVPFDMSTTKNYKKKYTQWTKIYLNY